MNHYIVFMAWLWGDNQDLIRTEVEFVEALTADMAQRVALNRQGLSNMAFIDGGGEITVVNQDTQEVI